MRWVGNFELPQSAHASHPPQVTHSAFHVEVNSSWFEILLTHFWVNTTWIRITQWWLNNNWIRISHCWSINQQLKLESVLTLEKTAMSHSIHSDHSPLEWPQKQISQKNGQKPKSADTRKLRVLHLIRNKRGPTRMEWLRLYSMHKACFSSSPTAPHGPTQLTRLWRDYEIRPWSCEAQTVTIIRRPIIMACEMNYCSQETTFPENLLVGATPRSSYRCISLTVTRILTLKGQPFWKLFQFPPLMGYQ